MYHKMPHTPNIKNIAKLCSLSGLRCGERERGVLAVDSGRAVTRLKGGGGGGGSTLQWGEGGGESASCRRHFCTSAPERRRMDEAEGPP